MTYCVLLTAAAWRAKGKRAAKFAAGHAFKDADKRRLFGEYLVLAGLPE